MFIYKKFPYNMKNLHYNINDSLLTLYWDVKVVNKAVFTSKTWAFAQRPTSKFYPNDF